MSTCPFVTGILFLIPVLLLTSDSKMMFKPRNRDTYNSEMNILCSFQHLWKSSRLV